MCKMVFVIVGSHLEVTCLSPLLPRPSPCRPLLVCPIYIYMYTSKLAEANAPLQALDGLGAKDYLSPVELCATLFGITGVWLRDLLIFSDKFQKYDFARKHS